MVSTRGVKPKFELGERVLCYDPDPKKMKMLYDAKVIGIRQNEKGSGEDKARRGFDYFVHFQGWSASWDRYVADDMLLKDNDAGRKEQKHLYEQTEDYRLRAERKKKRKSSDKTRVSLDSNTSPVPSESPDFRIQSRKSREDPFFFQEDEEIQFRRSRFGEERKSFETEDDKTELHESLSSSLDTTKDDEQELVKPEDKDENEDICTEPISLNLPPDLKQGLETDFKYISEGKLVKLPAQPNIVSLLEGFVRDYAISRLGALEKQIQKTYSQYRQADKDETELFEEVNNNVNIAKEVAEGFRILIDFHLGNILLYPQESGQFEKSMSIRPHMECIERLVCSNSPVPTPTLKSKPSRKSAPDSDEPTHKRRTLRKKESESEPAVPGSVGSASSGAETPVLPNSNQTHYPQFKQSLQILRDLQSWKLVPESVYFEEPVPASLVYGGVHLARFMVKIPDLLIKMKYPNKKLKYLVKYLEFIVEYLSSQEDVFVPSAYVK